MIGMCDSKDSIMEKSRKVGAEIGRFQSKDKKNNEISVPGGRRNIRAV